MFLELYIMKKLKLKKKKIKIVDYKKNQSTIHYASKNAKLIWFTKNIFKF